MNRLQNLLDAYVSNHQQLVKKGVSWCEEKYILGKIEGVRTAIHLINDPDSVIPSELCD